MLEVIEKDDAMGKSDMVGRWWPCAMRIGATPEEPALPHTQPTLPIGCGGQPVWPGWVMGGSPCQQG